MNATVDTIVDRRLQVGDRKIDELHSYRYRYRGIQLEICQQVNFHTVPWTYYLILHLGEFEDETLYRKLWLRAKTHNLGGSKFTCWDGASCAFLENLPWHGGVTFYEKRTCPDGSRYIKVGCDYGHYGDEGHTYTLRDVIADAEATVDALHEAAQYGGGDDKVPAEKGASDGSKTD